MERGQWRGAGGRGCFSFDPYSIRSCGLTDERKCLREQVAARAGYSIRSIVTATTTGAVSSSPLTSSIRSITSGRSGTIER